MGASEDTSDALMLYVALNGVPEVALVSVTEDALDGRSEGAPKSVLRDLHKGVPEGSFEVELKGAL